MGIVRVTVSGEVGAKVRGKVSGKLGVRVRDKLGSESDFWAWVRGSDRDNLLVRAPDS